MPSLLVDRSRDASGLRDRIWDSSTVPWISVWLNPLARSSAALNGSSQAPAPGRGVSHFKEEGHLLISRSPFSHADDDLSGFHCSCMVQAGVGERFGIGIAFQKRLLWGDDRPKDILVGLTIGKGPAVLILVAGKQMNVCGERQSYVYTRLAHEHFKLPILLGLGSKVLVGVTLTPLLDSRSLDRLPVTPLAAFDFEVKEGSYAREIKFANDVVPELGVTDRPRMRALHLVPDYVPPQPSYQYQNGDLAATSANTIGRLEGSKDRSWVVRPLSSNDAAAEAAVDDFIEMAMAETQTKTPEPEPEQDHSLSRASTGNTSYHSNGSWKTLPTPQWRPLADDVTGNRTPAAPASPSASHLDESELGTPPLEERPDYVAKQPPQPTGTTCLALVPYAPRPAQTGSVLAGGGVGDGPINGGAASDVHVDNEIGKLAALREKCLRLKHAKKGSDKQPAPKPKDNAAADVELSSSPHQRDVHSHSGGGSASMSIKGPAGSGFTSSLTSSSTAETKVPSSSTSSLLPAPKPNAGLPPKPPIPTAPRAYLVGVDVRTSVKAHANRSRERSSSKPATAPRAEMEASSRSMLQRGAKKSGDDGDTRAEVPVRQSSSEAAESTQTEQNGPLEPTTRDNIMPNTAGPSSVPKHGEQQPSYASKPKRNEAPPAPLFHDMTPSLSHEQREDIRRAVELKVPFIPGAPLQVGAPLLKGAQAQTQGKGKGGGGGGKGKGGAEHWRVQQAQKQQQKQQEKKKQKQQSPAQKGQATKGPQKDAEKSSSSLAPQGTKGQERGPPPPLGKDSGSLLSAVGAGPLVSWLEGSNGANPDGSAKQEPAVNSSSIDEKTTSSARLPGSGNGDKSEWREERGNRWKRLTGMGERSKDAGRERPERERDAGDMSDRARDYRRREQERESERRRDASRSPVRERRHERNTDDASRDGRSERRSRDEHERNSRHRQHHQHSRRHRDERSESRGRSRSPRPHAREGRRSRSRSLGRSRRDSPERRIKREPDVADGASHSSTARGATPGGRSTGGLSKLEEEERMNEVLRERYRLKKEMLEMELQMAQIKAAGGGLPFAAAAVATPAPIRPASVGGLTVPGQTPASWPPANGSHFYMEPAPPAYGKVPPRLSYAPSYQLGPSELPAEGGWDHEYTAGAAAAAARSLRASPPPLDRSAAMAPPRSRRGTTPETFYTPRSANESARDEGRYASRSSREEEAPRRSPWEEMGLGSSSRERRDVDDYDEERFQWERRSGKRPRLDMPPQRESPFARPNEGLSGASSAAPERSRWGRESPPPPHMMVRVKQEPHVSTPSRRTTEATSTSMPVKRELTETSPTPWSPDTVPRGGRLGGEWEEDRGTAGSLRGRGEGLMDPSASRLLDEIEGLSVRLR